MNRYAYVLNNPLSAIDPSGLDECTDSVDGSDYCDGPVGGDSEGGNGGDVPPSGYTYSGVNLSDGNPVYTNSTGDQWIGAAPERD